MCSLYRVPIPRFDSIYFTDPEPTIRLKQMDKSTKKGGGGTSADLKPVRAGQEMSSKFSNQHMAHVLCVFFHEESIGMGPSVVRTL